MKEFDLSAIRDAVKNTGESTPAESGLDRTLRYIRGGAGIALGAVAIVEGFRSLHGEMGNLRMSPDGKKPDRLQGAQSAVLMVGDILRGVSDIRRHTRTLRN